MGFVLSRFMDHLWTPWRFRYVSQVNKPGACVFCEIASLDPSRDREQFVLFRGVSNLVLLNRFPYTTGHAMIVPYAHQANFSDLKTGTLGEMMTLAQKLQKAVGAAYQPEGYNLGMNLGQCAGAGIADHLHLHVLPRWTGDTNFMTSVGETRILPEELSTTYDKLAPYFRG